MDNNNNKINDFYTDKEINKSTLISLILTVIIAIPFILIIVQLFSLFLMRVYLMTTITFIILYGLIIFSLFLRRWMLISIKKTEYSFKKEILIDSLIFLAIFIVIFLFVILFIIPRFVI